MKLTKTEAKRYLQNSKIFVESSEKSKLVQSKLFEIGINWICGEPGYLHLDVPYIYVDADHLTYGRNYEDFCKIKYQLLTVNDILSIEIIGCKQDDFKPFDKIIVKNNDKSYATFVSKVENDKILTMGLGWFPKSMCSHYK